MEPIKPERLSADRHVKTDVLRAIGRGAAISLSLLGANLAIPNSGAAERQSSGSNTTYHFSKAAEKAAQLLQTRIRHHEAVPIDASVDVYWSPSNSSSYTKVTDRPLDEMVNGQEYFFSVHFKKAAGVLSAVVQPIPPNHSNITDRYALTGTQVNSPTTTQAVLRNYQHQAYDPNNIHYTNGNMIQNLYIGDTHNTQG